MLVVGTTSIMLIYSAKQVGLVVIIGKLHPVAMLFKVEILGDHLSIYVELW